MEIRLERKVWGWIVSLHTSQFLTQKEGNKDIRIR